MTTNDTFHYVGDKLFCENVSIEEIVNKVHTPVYIYSKKQLLSNYYTYEKAFESVKHIICYAIKANSNPVLCKVLFSAGAGADITSCGELYCALSASVNPKKVVFAGVGKTSQEIVYSLQKGILMFNVESIEEMATINAVATQLHRKAPVSIRINLGIDPKTHKYISTSKNETKFGIHISEALQAYCKAKEYKNLDIIGIHYHIGSQVTSLKPFIIAAKRISGVVKKILNFGIRLKYVDIGGGLGICYHKEKPPTPFELANAVLPFFKDLQVTFILEPGRYIVGNTGILVTQVLYRKVTPYKRFLVIDTGMNHLIRPCLYDAYHEIIPVRRINHKKCKVDVVGPICETADFIAKDRFLPWCSRGELLAIRCVGAYGFSMSSNYNLRPKPAEVLVDENKWSIIRPLEKITDII